PLLGCGHRAAAKGEADPMFLPLGPTSESYNRLCGAVVSALWHHGLHITEMNPFEGRIEALTRVAFEDCSGSIALTLRLREMAPTHRHRAVVQIQTADSGGFWIRVTAYKESKGDSGQTWIANGRDGEFEQRLLARIRKSLLGEDEEPREEG